MNNHFRDKPKYEYCGLTIVLSGPSRFDRMSRTTDSLLNAGGGRIVNEALQPEFNRYNCDIRTIDETDPFISGTKCILVCGEQAGNKFIGNTTNTLGEIRGSPFYTQDKIPFICSLFPQDASDPKDFEGQFNGVDSFNDSKEDESDDDSKEDSIETKRRHGKTKRRNFRFWLEQDIKKCKHIIQYGIPIPEWTPNYILNSDANTIIRLLTTTSNKKMFIDLETWIPTPDVKCIGISFDCGPDVYVFPWFDYNCNRSYSALPEIIRALAVAINNNTVIAHNGKCFDFTVLAWKYRIPLTPRMEDTLIMMHRFYPEVERSLGHIISLFTWLKFHKDMGNTGYNNFQQQQQTLAYCGVDVYSMQLCYYEMIRRAEKIPGMIQSFNIANAAIYPYLLCELTGFKFDDNIRQKKLKENDRYMNWYLKCCEYLVGKKYLEYIRGKGKSSLLASSTQACKYFHEMLGYPVIGRGKLTAKGTRNPSLGKKNIFKLKLKHDNPVADLIINYRETAKESGTLKFQPWDINKTTIEPTPEINEDTIDQYTLPNI